MPKNRDASREERLEQLGVGLGRARVVNGRRPARRGSPFRLERQQVGNRNVVSDKLGVNAGLADAPGDQLRVPRAKVENRGDLAGVFGDRAIDKEYGI